MLSTISQVISNKLCIGCGACVALSNQGINFVEQDGMPIPQINSSSDEGLLRYCAGYGYNIVNMGKSLYGNSAIYDEELGYINAYCAARTADSQVAGNASSGGAITSILLYLLDEGKIEGALVTKFCYGSSGPVPISYIARNKYELLEAQGSKYCPVSTLTSLRNIVAQFSGRIAWVATPCQIAGLRMIQEDDKELRKKILYTVTNFCGGFRDFREARRLAQLCGVNFSDISDFRYRGGGQPGFMRIVTHYGDTYSLPYPDYARRTGFTKLKRCRLCVDATGELADFSCGDAWIPRFLNSGTAWSIILTRSTAAKNILQEMVDLNKIITKDITIDELKLSQFDNLSSKKMRQYARRKLYKLLGSQLPVYDGGFKVIRTGEIKELRIHLQYLLFNFLEKIRLYTFVAKLIGRYR